jgi:hypothetical protein
MNYDELIKTLKEDKSYWERPIYVEEPNGRKYCMAYLGEKDSFYYVERRYTRYEIKNPVRKFLSLTESKFNLHLKIDYPTLLKKLENRELWNRVIEVNPPEKESFYISYIGIEDSFYLVNFTEEDGFSMGKQIGLPLTLSKSMFRLSDNPGFKY